MGSLTNIMNSLVVLLVALIVGCRADCSYNIVESMPDGLNLTSPDGVEIVKTHESLIGMAESANKTLKIASFYWFLTAPPDLDGNPATLPGRLLMDAIKRAAARGVAVEVVLDGSSKKDMNNPSDLEALRKAGVTVKSIDMKRLLHGGVMHTKFMIADSRTFYLGSSNFDWRSYTEIKEMGLTFGNCSSLAVDLEKIFRVYMLLADAKTMPSQFSDDLKTSINLEHPIFMRLDESDSQDSAAFLGGSPPAFNGQNDWSGRTDDIDGLLHLIRRASWRISISVMNYSPRMEFVWPRRYWPRIDDALREAATTRKVRVELLFSNWSSTRSSELAWYSSLNSLHSHDFGRGGIHVKLFKVPAFDDYQKRIPYARVKHDKFMVTDNGLYLGTSNWTPDYFVNTAGVSLVIRPNINGRGKQNNGDDDDLAIISNFQQIFDRDFNSEYAHELTASPRT